MNLAYQNILKYIYKNYYQQSSVHSDVTSSFWKESGSQHVVQFKKGNYELSGYGIGDFINNSMWKQIRHFPESYLSKALLKKHRCNEAVIKNGLEVTNRSGRTFNFDCAKHLLAVNEIIKHLPCGDRKNIKLTQRGVKTACVIGDGYNFFSNLLKMLDPNIKLVSVNLGRSLFFDVYFSAKCLPNEKTALLCPEDDIFETHDNSSIIFLEAEKYDLLRGLPIDLFINITSMQEMDPSVVQKYFDYMRASTSENVYFYCCNRKEKRLPDNTIVRFEDYPWQLSTIIFDELCPWHQKFPTSNYPFWKPFDGPIQHRFVRLK